MRGILSFLLVILLIESIIYFYYSYNSHIKTLYKSEEEILVLQNFYDKKMKVKRSIQNIISEPLTTASQNPYDKIEEVAARLESYESEVELSEIGNIDIWCGYVSNDILGSILSSFREGITPKPPTVFDPRTKIIIETEEGPRELHACTIVLVYNYEKDRVSIGRGNIDSPAVENILLLRPVIGISIKDPVHNVYDIDYVDVT